VPSSDQQEVCPVGQAVQDMTLLFLTVDSPIAVVALSPNVEQRTVIVLLSPVPVRVVVQVLLPAATQALRASE